MGDPHRAEPIGDVGRTEVPLQDQWSLQRKRVRIYAPEEPPVVLVRQHPNGIGARGQDAGPPVERDALGLGGGRIVSGQP